MGGIPNVLLRPSSRAGLVGGSEILDGGLRRGHGAAGSSGWDKGPRSHQVLIRTPAGVSCAASGLWELCVCGWGRCSLLSSVSRRAGEQVSAPAQQEVDGACVIACVGRVGLGSFPAPSAPG